MSSFVPKCLSFKDFVIVRNRAIHVITIQRKSNRVGISFGYTIETFLFSRSQNKFTSFLFLNPIQAGVFGRSMSRGEETRNICFCCPGLQFLTQIAHIWSQMNILVFIGLQNQLFLSYVVQFCNEIAQKKATFIVEICYLLLGQFSKNHHL